MDGGEWKGGGERCRRDGWRIIEWSWRGEGGEVEER